MSVASSIPEVADLHKVPLFARLSPDALADLAARFRIIEVEAHRVVVWFGERGDTFYVVASGELSVSVPSEQGHDQELNRLGAGGFFGELSLLDGGPRSATVRTREQSRLLMLSRQDFMSFVDSRPEAAGPLLVVMAERHRQSLALLREQPNPVAAFVEHGSIWTRGAARIVELASQWWFAVIHVLLFASWFGVNILAFRGVLPAWMQFDDVYAFNKFKMVAAVESMLLTMFVLATQRATRARDRAKAEIEYQINLKAQTQISQLTHKIDAMQALLAERLGEVRPPAQSDPDASDLAVAGSTRERRRES